MRQVSLFLFLISFNIYFGQEKAILSIDNEQVLKSEFEQIYWKNKKEKIATLIMGGPNKYYNFDEKSVEQIFLRIYNIFIKKI